MCGQWFYRISVLQLRMLYICECRCVFSLNRLLGSRCIYMYIETQHTYTNTHIQYGTADGHILIDFEVFHIWQLFFPFPLSCTSTIYTCAHSVYIYTAIHLLLLLSCFYNGTDSAIQLSVVC